jgi:hypothetical protein
MVFHHFPSCFQTGLVQTSSILVLDHPWFNSLVPCLTWFWMVLLCFDTPGPWHCWTHLNPPHNKIIQNQLMNLTHPSWFTIIFIHFLSCFQTALAQTSSILVLDHPWFNSLVPWLTWFWYPWPLALLNPLHDHPADSPRLFFQAQIDARHLKHLLHILTFSGHFIPQQAGSLCTQCPVEDR